MADTEQNEKFLPPPNYNDLIEPPSKHDDVSETSSTDSTQRDSWGGKLEFILSCLSYAVGLGNLWRFPYLCYRNGGGAFLIPYVIMMVFAGIPLFFMEVSFGQYARKGVVDAWDACPLFKGIGWGMFLVSCVVGLYYNIIVAWSFYYLFASFTGQLPWSVCHEDWKSPYCSLYVESENSTCHMSGGVYMYANNTCVNGTALSNSSLFELQDLARRQFVNFSDNLKHPADDYFHYETLGISGGIDQIGAVQWKLALCLLLAWTVIVVLLSKGIKSMGKASYFTAFFPYAVLFVLLVRGVTLEGASEGIIFYLKPNFETLKSAKVWGDAAVQIFFSLSPCWGGLVTLGSYNKFHNNCLRDTIIVCFGNCGTSVFAGFVIFGIIGFMAHELGLPVEKVVSQGPGVAFIAYPQAVTKLPVSPMWSILFFLMLLTLGFGTQFTVVTTIHTTLMDKFPVLRKTWYKVLSLAAIAVTFFLLGLVFVTEGGMFVFQLVDNYGASYSVLFLGFTECVVICYVYGIRRFVSNIEEMIQQKLSIWWKIMWMAVTPGIILFIIIFKIADFKPSTYADYTFPHWADSIGWCLSIVPFMPVVIVVIFTMVTYSRENKLGCNWLGFKKAFADAKKSKPGFGEESEKKKSIELSVIDFDNSKSTLRTPMLEGNVQETAVENISEKC